MEDEKERIHFTPCRPPNDCSEYADDEYDPCESDEDITEKDFAVLKEEEKKQKERKKILQSLKAEKAEIAGKAESEFGGADKHQGPIKDKEPLKVKYSSTESVDKYGQKKKHPSKEKDVKNNGELRESMINYFKPTEDEEIFLRKSSHKKQKCRKVIKNPFYKNRLDFSSNLPLRPPTPPPQFYPMVVDEERAEYCRKLHKRKLRLENKMKMRRGSKGSRGSREGADSWAMGEEGGVGALEETESGTLGEGEARGKKKKRTGAKREEEKEGKEDKKKRKKSKSERREEKSKSEKQEEKSHSERGKGKSTSERDDWDSTSGEGTEGGESDEDETRSRRKGREKSGSESDELSGMSERKKKKRCRKTFKKPCRKVSDDLVNLAIRKIPHPQRALPPKCPKEEALMERRLPVLCKVECLIKKNQRKNKK